MEWHPQTKQEIYLSNPYYEVGFGGTKGPGKTDALLMDATYQKDKPNYKAIIFRRTFVKLQEIIQRSHKWFTKSAHWNGELKQWTWPSGALLKFAHCQYEEDKYNYQGHEYQFMGFDQLEEFTETMYLFLMAQNRTSDPDIECFIRSTFNPGGVGHAWVKRRFIDPLDHDGTPRYFIRRGEDFMEVPKGTPKALARAFIFSRLEDNKALIESDPDYEARLDQLPEKLRRALKEGDWDAYEGQYFDTWRREIHVIKPYKIEGPRKNIIGIDYGYAKPASIGWYACLPDGDIIRYREWYGESKTYKTLAQLILEKTPSNEEIAYAVGDPAIWGDKAHHDAKPKDGEIKGETGAETMRNVFGNRINLIKGDNRRVAGWGRLREYIEPFLNQHGFTSAKFRVFSTNYNFIRTFPGLIHDSIRVEDVDTDGEDHCADEARYVVMSRPPLPKRIAIRTPASDFWDRVKKDIKPPYMEGEQRELNEEGSRSLQHV